VKQQLKIAQKRDRKFILDTDRIKVTNRTGKPLLGPLVAGNNMKKQYIITNESFWGYFILDLD